MRCLRYDQVPVASESPAAAKVWQGHSSLGARNYAYNAIRGILLATKALRGCVGSGDDEGGPVRRS